jgi:hypothetical protein
VHRAGVASALKPALSKLPGLPKGVGTSAKISDIRFKAWGHGDTLLVRNRFEWVSADSEGMSISLVKKIGKKDPLSGQR